MDLLLNVLYYSSLLLIPVAVYSVIFKQEKDKDWFYIIKFFYGRRIIRKLQHKCRLALEKTPIDILEGAKKIESEKYSDNQFIYGIDQNDNSICVRLTNRNELLAEVYLILRLSDGTIYTIPGDSIKITSISSYKWKTKDLHIEIVDPLRRLRLTYNGELENKTKNIKEHVKFNLIWSSGGRPQFYPQDAAPGLLMEALAKETWRDGDWLRLLGEERGYDQFGCLRGTISGDSFHNEIKLNLPSCRTRFWGVDEKLAVKDSLHLLIACKDGTVFNIWGKKFKNGVNSLRYGNIISNRGEIAAIDDLDFDLDSLTKHKRDLPVATIRVMAHRRVYTVVMHLQQKKSAAAVNDESRGYRLISGVAECQIDTKPGRAIVEFWSSHSGNGVNLPTLILIDPTTNDKLPSRDYVLKFENEFAKSVQLSGGKGSSLAMLATLDSKDFSVPDGFIVTVNAFNRQLDVNFNLKKAVSILDDICCQKTTGDLESACAETVKAFANENILPEIANAVKTALDSVRIDDVITTKRFAVRSSGVSEDGEELSAAGQNETFLGCQNADDVIKAIAKCWGSLFTFQSVQYRHQHGLPVKTEMAVVVQLMVPSDCAGVLFTCHPSTCNPAQLVITSNHGLGESVVSGHSEPDTVIITRDLKITSKTPGSKLKVIKMTDDGVGEFTSQNTDFSVSDFQAVTLAKVGLTIEDAFGNPRDIEWAFYRDTLYLLQSRPVTTLENWTDDELLHEMDVATLSENTLYTVANTGEVFPGATSVLTLTSVVAQAEKGLQMNIFNGRTDAYVNKCCPSFQHHVFVDVFMSLYRNTSKEASLMTKIIDLAVFGHPVINDEINAMTIDRFGVLPKLQLFFETLVMFKFAWNNAKTVKKCKSLAQNIEIDIDETRDTVKDVYVKISQALPNFEPIIQYHGCATVTSIFYQIFAVQTLLEGKTDFFVEHYKDISEILSSCNDVISAEVPAMLEKIAMILAENEKMEEFAKLAPQDGREWLKSNCAAASQVFEEFLNLHGHRALGEFDLRNDNWSLKPEIVIKMLQANCAQTTEKRSKIVKSTDDVITNLVSPKKNLTRQILKFVIKHSRVAVGRREQTKSETVRFVTKLRIAYRKLAKKMRIAGFIPDEALIYYMTHYEIGQIIEGRRKPGLIRKALRRQRLFPKWNDLTFPELNFGIPSPENDDEIEVGGGEIKCEGTPVCAGVIKARACVITDLREIHQLQKGDILVTYSTDIGWSPYFPIISGIVTELGGLVSHGAVIAREYGLPCIVGVKRATKVFKTGDIVILSGTNGILELAEQ